ncbi:hypothetical protein DY000_02026784 [Brassica cretica]|uniref:Uncharacterized protein n=1 Tax=Brassica cretica TaxID=69181 RepID=A0ABQ7EHY9_BRACR|nr:hypothetical protein DY000_02026784 [Brassica cretica]
MGRYSYTQPSDDEDLFGNNDDSDYSETDDLIRRDEAELSLERSSQVHYPPQPEVEFGFPQVCYCGAKPLLATSNTRQDQASFAYVKQGEDITLVRRKTTANAMSTNGGMRR